MIPACRQPSERLRRAEFLRDAHSHLRAGTSRFRHTFYQAGDCVPCAVCSNEGKPATYAELKRVSTEAAGVVKELRERLDCAVLFAAAIERDLRAAAHEHAHS